MKVAWITRECDFGQRALVCSRTDEGVEQNIGDRKEAINSFLSTDRQTNREDKTRAGTVSKNIH